MQILGDAPPVPTDEEVIAQVGDKLVDILKQELSDDADLDRIYLLRNLHKNYLYFRDLQYTAPSVYQGLVDVTGINGPILDDNDDDDASGVYDYTQNRFRGYARKWEAVLGARMPNAIATPRNPDDPDSIKATRSANACALYVRDICDLEEKHLFLSFGMFLFGTMFYHMDWNVDPDKYGYETTTDVEQETGSLGNTSFNCANCATAVDADSNNLQPPESCPQCGAPMSMADYQAPTSVNVPKDIPRQVPKGQIEISLHGAAEVFVPLDSTSVNDETCGFLHYRRERPKAVLLHRYPQLRQNLDAANETTDNAAIQYADQIRSSFASPIGLMRPLRDNRWIESFTWFKPSQYELLKDQDDRDLMNRMYPTGVKFTLVRGNVVKLEEEKMVDVWQECKPEPSMRIMGDPIGNDWIQTVDILNNLLNQCNETVERANLPGFGDPTKIDFDAWQRNKDKPGELVPALPRAGGQLSDIIYYPPPIQFSEQIAPFGQGVEEVSKNNTGLLDPIWGGGDAEEPTARQAELKKNAAMMQLGIHWAQMRRSLAYVYLKACRLISNYAQGVLAFSKKTPFGRFQTIAITVGDLRNEGYKFEVDEAVPMTWGQQRDLIMWMLDKEASVLHAWGYDHPLNIFENKQLLGMPGEYTPGLDQREKVMDVISQLLAGAPQAGPANPDGSPGQQVPSVQPDWEDDPAICAGIVKAYLQANAQLKQVNQNGYQNVVLYGQICEKNANQPPPPAPPKGTVAVSLKGPDLGDPAVQAALSNANILPPGTPVTSDTSQAVGFRQNMGLDPKTGNAPALPLPPPPNGMPIAPAPLTQGPPQ